MSFGGYFFFKEHQSHSDSLYQKFLYTLKLITFGITSKLSSCYFFCTICFCPVPHTTLTATLTNPLLTSIWLPKKSHSSQIRLHIQPQNQVQTPLQSIRGLHNLSHMPPMSSQCLGNYSWDFFFFFGSLFQIPKNNFKVFNFCDLQFLHHKVEKRTLTFRDNLEIKVKTCNKLLLSITSSSSFSSTLVLVWLSGLQVLSFILKEVFTDKLVKTPKFHFTGEGKWFRQGTIYLPWPIILLRSSLRIPFLITTKGYSKAVEIQCYKWP